MMYASRRIHIAPCHSTRTILHNSGITVSMQSTQKASIDSALSVFYIDSLSLTIIFLMSGMSRIKNET